MNHLKPTSVVLAALVAAAVPAFGQGRDRLPPIRPDMMMLAGGGSEIGVTVRDVDRVIADRQKLDRGVVVDSVRPSSPAEQAGIQKADIITEFDGERVRSVRQFSRLVRETPPGRTVKAVVLRDGRTVDVTVTPAADRAGEVFLDRERLREELGRLGDRMLDWDLPGDRARLGVTVDEMTPQLAEYFGAKNGLLVSAVTTDSPAARAGLKVGDVIVSVENRPVNARRDLVQALRDARDGQALTIGIVRDKRETTVNVTPASRRAPM